MLPRMSRHLFRRGGACLLAGLLPGGLAAAEVARATLATPGGPRSYLVATPAGPSRPGRPLVLLLHGHTGSAAHTLGQVRGTGSPLAAWLAIADREGVVLAALDGARGGDGKQGWNDGRPGGRDNPATDDVGFVRGVILALERTQGVDPARVFVMGMSNGGVMAQRVALDLDLPLAAVASVCATMPGDRAPDRMARPLSVLLVEGTADPLMPYGGGQVTFFGHPRGAVVGVDGTLAYWRRVDGLEDPPVIERLPHLGGTADPTRVMRETWGQADGLQVQLLKVEGGGHAEPTRSRRYGWVYRAVAGRQNGDLECAEAAWAFFRDKRSRP